MDKTDHSLLDVGDTPAGTTSASASELSGPCARVVVACSPHPKTSSRTQGTWSPCTQTRDEKPGSTGQFEFRTGWSCLTHATDFPCGPGTLETPPTQRLNGRSSHRVFLHRLAPVWVAPHLAPCLCRNKPSTLLPAVCGAASGPVAARTGKACGLRLRQKVALGEGRVRTGACHPPGDQRADRAAILSGESGRGLGFREYICQVVCVHALSYL